MAIQQNQEGERHPANSPEASEVKKRITGITGEQKRLLHLVELLAPEQLSFRGYSALAEVMKGSGCRAFQEQHSHMLCHRILQCCMIGSNA